MLSSTGPPPARALTTPVPENLPRKAASILGTAEVPGMKPNPALRAGLPYERQANGPTRRPALVSARAAAQTADWRAEGIFTMMAKQQRKKPLIRLSATKSQKSSAPAPTSHPVKHRANESAARKGPSGWIVNAGPEPRDAQQRSRISKPTPRRSITSLPRVNTLPMCSDYSPVPSLTHGSDSPTSSSGSPPQHYHNHMSSRAVTVPRHQKETAYELFAPPEPQNETTSPRDISPELYKLQTWFESMALAEEEGRYARSRDSMASNFTGPSGEHQSIELAALSYEHHLNKERPGEFQAFLLPTPARSHFTRSDMPSREPEMHAAMPVYLTAEQLFSERASKRMSECIEGMSVLDLSESPREEVHSLAALHYHHQSRRSQDSKDSGTRSSLEERLSSVHPARRAEYLSGSGGRRDSTISTASTLQSPSCPQNVSLKAHKQNLGSSTENNDQTISDADSTFNVQNQGSNQPVHSSHMMAVSKEEAALLSSIRRKRASMHQRQFHEGYNYAKRNNSCDDHRRSKSESELSYSREYSRQVAGEMEQLLKNSDMVRSVSAAGAQTRPRLTTSQADRASRGSAVFASSAAEAVQKLDNQHITQSAPASTTNNAEAASTLSSDDESKYSEDHGSVPPIRTMARSRKPRTRLPDARDKPLPPPPPQHENLLEEIMLLPSINTSLPTLPVSKPAQPSRVPSPTPSIPQSEIGATVPPLPIKSPRRSHFSAGNHSSIASFLISPMTPADPSLYDDFSHLSCVISPPTATKASFPSGLGVSAVDYATIATKDDRRTVRESGYFPPPLYASEMPSVVA